MLTIGICGASGSGKSTLAQELQKRMRGSVVLLTQDSYYRDHSHLPFEERKRINYDEPSVFEHDCLLDDVIALQQGRSISAKGYDFPNHCRADSGEEICRFELSEDFAEEMAIEFGRLEVREGVWRFEPTGLAHPQGLRSIVDKYC